jgi:ABC-type uncharacterized transport system involved in gliding motility auxiliary subunit
LILNRSGMEQKDVTTSQIDELLLPCPGAFSGTPAPGLKEEVLMKSSENSQLADNMMLDRMQERIAGDFKKSGIAYAMAIRLTGKFKTAFPEGKPKAAANDPEKKDEKKETNPEAGLKETAADNVVTLVGDADFIYDRFCARVQTLPFFNQKIIVPQFGNLALGQGMIEQLAGDSSLIGARSRASLSRPFDKLNEMQAKANQKWQETLKQLEDKRQEAQRKLNELHAQQDPSGGQRMILTADQKKLIAQYKQEEADAAKKLKQVKKDLARDTESLQTRLKWINIAVMPLIVTMVGISLAIVRRQRTKAK